MGKIEVTAETWDLITAIEETIEAVLAREGEQVEQRKTQEQELNRLGALFADDGRGRSSLEKKLKEAGLADKQVQILLTRSDHVVTLRAIKELRARYDALNNKLREVVRDTNQGKLFPESKSDITALTKEPVESALFAEPPKAEVQDADQMQFGEDGQAQNGETRAKEDGYTPGEGEPREDPIAKTSIKGASRRRARSPRPCRCW